MFDQHRQQPIVFVSFVIFIIYFALAKQIKLVLFLHINTYNFTYLNKLMKPLVYLSVECWGRVRKYIFNLVHCCLCLIKRKV